MGESDITLLVMDICPELKFYYSKQIFPASPKGSTRNLASREAVLLAAITRQLRRRTSLVNVAN